MKNIECLVFARDDQKAGLEILYIGKNFNLFKWLNNIPFTSKVAAWILGGFFTTLLELSSRVERAWCK